MDPIEPHQIAQVNPSGDPASPAEQPSANVSATPGTPDSGAAATGPPSDPAAPPAVDNAATAAPVSSGTSTDPAANSDGGLAASDLALDPNAAPTDLIGMANQHLSMIDFGFLAQLVDRGGPVVTILLCMSVFGLAVMLLKLAQFLWRGVGNGRAVERAMGLWIGGDAPNAIEALEGRRQPTAVVASHAMGGLSRGADPLIVREDAERLALFELDRLKAYLRALEAISQVAPLLGLFGTVIGMIAAFETLQASGADADPAALAGGIWVALITTAVGLAVAIPAALALYWFEGRINVERGQMERTLTSIFTMRLEHASRPQPPNGQEFAAYEAR